MTQDIPVSKVLGAGHLACENIQEVGWFVECCCWFFPVHSWF